MASNARTDMCLNVLGCIRSFVEQHHYPPTMKEICELVGLRSKGTLAVHLCALRDLGLLAWQPAQERTFVVTDRAWVALEVLKAWFDAQGTSTQRRFRRRWLMRNVLCRPEVQAAIEDMMASRGIAQRDAFALMAAHIDGTDQTVRLRNGKYVKVKGSPRQSLAALKAYFQMTGFLPSCPSCGYS